MIALLNILFVLSIALLVGTIFCFSVLTAPTLFRELPKEISSDLISKFFPPYYLGGYLTLFMALISLTLKGILTKPFPWLRLVLILVMLAGTIFAGMVIRPKTHALKQVIKTMEAGPEVDAKTAQFNKLHGLSVALNITVFVLGMIVLGATVAKIP